MVAPPVIELAGTSRRPQARHALLVATPVIAVTAIFGLWWVTLLAGLVIGLWLGGLASGSAAIAGMLGWGAALLWEDLQVPLGGVASAVAGIMGFGTGSGILVVVLTVVLGGLLAGVGAWVGAAVRDLVAPAHS